ncbi:MAG: type III-A CRISPR-associated RAMP protein Csm3 [Chitinophagales bacterium]|nr:type III-A CRISPR-associated RAMP protein Csm3 [Chitinophagales bacterium]
MQLNKKLIISGKITAVTGIAIGGTNAAMSIGGVDKGVIRNPITNEPYIPGSSLKGKMRSLLELREGTLGDEPMGIVKNGPTTDQRFRAARLFGNAVKGDSKKQRPSRVVVRDAYLDKEQVNSGYFQNADLPFTEVKTEVVIDRITSRAMPRQLERVPAGARFDFEIVINFFDGHDRSKENTINPDEQDNAMELIEDLFSAMQLLQNDYIGAAGSRGSGQIRFETDSLKVVERSRSFYEMKSDEKDVTGDFKKYFPK